MSEIAVGDVIYGGFRGGVPTYQSKVSRVYKSTIRIREIPGMIIDKATLRGIGDDEEYCWFRTQQEAEAESRMRDEWAKLALHMYRKSSQMPIGLTRDDFEQAKRLLRVE